MNLPTAALVILFGTFTAFWPAPKAEMTFEQRWEPAKVFLEPAPPAHPVHTFEERWEPVKRMPRMLLPEVQDNTPRVIPVRTIPIRPEPAVYIEQPQERPEPKSVPLPQERPKVVVMRKASLDICQRHNMRKVHYGRTWRCRK